MSQNQPILFIVGFPRSGTSMLVQLLNLHPKIDIQHESKYIPGYFKRFCTLYKRKRFSDIYHDMNRFLKNKSRYTGEVSEDRILKLLSNSSSHNVKETYIKLILETIKVSSATSESIIGDKTPEYIRHILFLKELFPNAKFLHLLRDGRDAFLSIKDLNWEPGNVYFAAHEWKKYWNCWEDAKSKISENDMLTIRYEDLLSSPLEELEKACQFLNVEYSIEFFEKFRLKTSNSLKWENKFKMTSGEVFIFQKICKKELEMSGYKLWDNLKMPFWRLFTSFLWVDQAWKYLMNKVYRSALFKAK